MQDMRLKLLELMEYCGIDKSLEEANKLKFAKFISKIGKLSEDTRIDSRVIKHWLDEPNVDIRIQTKSKFFKITENIGFAFSDYLIGCKFADFTKNIPSYNYAEYIKCEQTKLSFDIESYSNLFGLYQVFRPHSLDPEQYVLESMQLSKGVGGIVQKFTSHRHPHHKLIYSGSAYVSKKYYFSLIDRKIDENSNERAFRCVALYLGEEIPENMVFGLMTRGLHNNTITHGTAALPFIALKLSIKEELNKICPKKIDNVNAKHNLHLLFNNSHLITGIINNKNTNNVYKFCKKIIDNQVLKQKICESPIGHHNDLVLRGVCCETASNILNISEEEWLEVLKGDALLREDYSISLN